MFVGRTVQKCRWDKNRKYMRSVLEVIAFVQVVINIEKRRGMFDLLDVILMMMENAKRNFFLSNLSFVFSKIIIQAD